MTNLFKAENDEMTAEDSNLVKLQDANGSLDQYQD